MAIWEQFPFTNFNEQNLDWLLYSVKNLDERVDTLENSGAVSKDYVDDQDATLDEKITAERSSRTTNDQILQNQITAHTTSIGQLSDRVETAEENIGAKGNVPSFGSLWAVIGNYNATQALGDKLIQVQINEQSNGRSIAGTNGTYDISKGTIQARLNTIESALQSGSPVPSGSLVKENGFYTSVLQSGTANGFIYQLSNLVPFNFCIVSRDSSAPLAASDGIFFTVSHAPSESSADNTYTDISLELHCPGESLTKNVAFNVRTFVLVQGTSGDQYATVSYVDEKAAQLTTELGNVETDTQEAYTKAETAENNAASANTMATKAVSDASNALAQIGSKSSSVTFANLWATIGSWAESVPMTERINPAYNWSWNNRTAINGTADYPTDKASINARLSELEGNSAQQKIVSGSTTVTVTSGQETVIDYADAGFTAVPQVFASYSTDGGNPSVSGIIKIFNKTTTGCKITISSGESGVRYPIDWIATGT